MHGLLGSRAERSAITLSEEKAHTNFQRRLQQFAFLRDADVYANECA
jgi:hypothetical protein